MRKELKFQHPVRLARTVWRALQSAQTARLATLVSREPPCLQSVPWEPIALWVCLSVLRAQPGTIVKLDQQGRRPAVLERTARREPVFARSVRRDFTAGRQQQCQRSAWEVLIAQLAPLFAKRVQQAVSARFVQQRRPYVTEVFTVRTVQHFALSARPATTVQRALQNN